MRQTLLKLIITIAALLVLTIRVLKPDIDIDSTSLILIALATLPWVSTLVKSLELPGGFKIGGVLGTQYLIGVLGTILN